jgi:hypothetical protein
MAARLVRLVPGSAIQVLSPVEIVRIEVGNETWLRIAETRAEVVCPAGLEATVEILAI